MLPGSRVTHPPRPAAKWPTSKGQEEAPARETTVRSSLRSSNGLELPSDARRGQSFY